MNDPSDVQRGPVVALDGPRATLGEGPCWFRDALWWVDIDGRTIHHWSAADGHDVVAVERSPSAVLPDEQGGVVVATDRGVERLEGDLLHTIVAVEADDPATRANDAACDPEGRLFLGTMHRHALPGRGTLYRIGPGGVEVVYRPVSISNGLGWSPDGSRMYYADTATGAVDRAIRDESGWPGPREVHIPRGAAPGVPDGLAVASDGSIWVARWEGSCVSVHHPDGTLRTTIPLPAQRVTSCTFGGDDLDVLFVTSADDPDDRSGSAGAVFAVPVSVQGISPTPWVPTAQITADDAPTMEGRRSR